jgi:cytochrome c-type biogenesis protein CcmH
MPIWPAICGFWCEQVIEFLVARYGEFVLLKPRFGTSTFLLWGLPLLALGGGAIAVVIAARARRKRKSADEMTDDEKARLASILEQH